MIIAVDLDGVIAEEKATFERSLASVLPGAVPSLSELKQAGHRIIVYTARGWAEYEMTKSWLQENQVPHDELIMGKPIVDAFIDDRAVRFKNWPEAIGQLGDVRSTKVDTLSESNLALVRESAYQCVFEAAEHPDLDGPILEVGPMWSGSGVFERFPDLFVDSRALFERKGHTYKSMDIDPDTQPDIVGDFAYAEKDLPANEFGAVLLNHCLEHMPGLFRAPSVIQKILKPGGRAFMATPWNFRFHGPRPDCWRISDDGYEALFNESTGFKIEGIRKVATPSQPLHPAAVHCIAVKL